MADVSVSLGVEGKDTVLGAFGQVGDAGRKMGETFGSIAGKLAGLAAGYLSVSAAAHAFFSVMDKGGQLSDFSDQTGIAVDKLVILGRAFENNGMKADDLGGIVNKMQKHIAEAGISGSEAADKINKLGIRVSDIQGLDPDKQFEIIGKAIAGIQDPTERAAAAMEIFGKSGGRILAFLSDFDGNITQAKEEIGSFAEEMGQSSKTFDAIGDGFRAISEKSMEFTAGILDEAAPAIKMLVDYFKGVDATALGQSFSDSLMSGLRVALSVFTNPGNLFLAFGDALVLAFKTGVNALDNGIVYVLDWTKNILSSIIPNYADLLKATFMAAVGSVVSFLSGQLSDIFLGIAGYLPEKFGGPLAEIGNQLAQTSDEWSNKAAVGLAKAWDGISTAASKATEETHLQSADYMNAAGSAADLRDHLAIAEESGGGLLDRMSQSVEQARLITAEANAWEKAGDNIAKNLSGATDSFRAFANSGDTETSGLAAASGLKTMGSAGPLATAQDLLRASGSNATARAATARGDRTQNTREPTLGDIMNSLLKREDYINQSNASGPAFSASWDQLQQRMAIRASQQTASDLSNYTGGDARASRSQAIDDLFRKYQQDIGGNPADLRKKAEDDFNKLMQDKLDNGQGASDGSGNPGAAGGKDGGKPDPMSGISETVNNILKFMNENLPQHALS